METFGIEAPSTALAAKLAVADLVHGYALHVRAGDGAACAALFCEDGSFETRYLAGQPAGARHVGRAAVAAFLRESVREANAIWPMIQNLVVEVSGETARSRCMMMAMNARCVPLFVGWYEDTFVREERWKFASRLFTMSPAG